MKTQIGAYEAKTKLPQLLQEVRSGKRFTITNRGQAIADLIPSHSALQRDKAQVIEKFRAFLKRNPVRRKVNVKALLREGRA